MGIDGYCERWVMYKGFKIWIWVDKFFFVRVLYLMVLCVWNFYY